MTRQNALLWAAALLCSWLLPAFAIEVTEPAGGPAEPVKASANR